jgi:hypothetical protein
VSASPSCVRRSLRFGGMEGPSSGGTRKHVRANCDGGAPGLATAPKAHQRSDDATERPGIFRCVRRPGQFVNLADMTGGLAKMEATASGTSRLSIGEVRPAPKGNRIVESLAMDFSDPSLKEKVLEKNRCSAMHDRYVAGSVDRRQGNWRVFGQDQTGRRGRSTIGCPSLSPGSRK